MQIWKDLNDLTFACQCLPVEIHEVNSQISQKLTSAEKNTAVSEVFSAHNGKGVGILNKHTVIWHTFKADVTSDQDNREYMK